MSEAPTNHRYSTTFKRTKILATVGPSTHSYETVLSLIRAGANGLRLNFSHGNNEERAQQIKWIRQAAKEVGRPVAIIQDLQGPKIRLGDFEGEIDIEKGQEVTFGYKANFEETGVIPTQFDLSTRLQRSHRLFLADGKVRMVVNSVRNGIIYATAQNHGVLSQRKGINVPDTSFEGKVITAKDRKDIAFGAQHDIDYVALSFVQSAKDVEALRRLMARNGSNALIISKIETQQAMENLDEVIEASDGAMVARGDLAIETPLESVPVSQRQIIAKCIEHEKISIVATQMLSSMMHNSEPTRAEVSDIATAVIVGADAVMLSDETAVGRYPVESIGVMKKIIVYTQSNLPWKMDFKIGNENSIHGAISASITTLAEKTGAKAIVAETKSGRTARSVSARRPLMPIVMVTSNKRVANQLALVYGGDSYVRPDSRLAGTKLTDWLVQHKLLHKGDIVLISSGKDPGVSGGTDTIKVRVLD